MLYGDWPFGIQDPYIVREIDVEKWVECLEICYRGSCHVGEARRGYQ